MCTETIPLPPELTEHLELVLIIWPQIDAENLKRCVDFTIYHVCYGKYSIPNKSQTETLLETFSTKYDYLGYSDFADELSNCVRNYSAADPKEKHDYVEAKWHILEFLTKLSKDPFKTSAIYYVEGKLEASKRANYAEEITEEEYINWYTYLRKGHEKYELPLDESGDGDDTFAEFNSFRNTTPND